MSEKKKGSCLKRTAIVIIALIIAGFAGRGVYQFATRVPTRDPGKKVIIIGLDGAQFDLVEQYMQEGALPTFKKIADAGVFTHLKTTNPPESPVAWASFAISGNPGKHGVYDFLKKANREDPLPGMGGVEPVPPKFWKETVPVRMPKAVNLRKGETFWGIAAKDGLRVVALQTAMTFPPEELPNGYMMSGLNVPDIRGTQATFSYLTTDWERVGALDTEFGGKILELKKDGDYFTTDIIGPWNPINQSYKYERDLLSKKLNELPPGPELDRLQAKIDEMQQRIQEIDMEKPDLLLPVKFKVLDGETAEMNLGGKTSTIKTGEWSEWSKVSFKVTPLVSIHGIMKVWLESTEPHLSVYCTPIDFDPSKPPIPITYPSGLSKDLVKALGHPFKTRGWAEETAGLKEGYIPEEAFIEDMNEITDNLEAMTLHMMDNKKWDILVSIFSNTDRAQHLMWRYIDPLHPLYTEEGAAQFGDAIKNVYIRMDQMIARVMERMDPETTIMVLSDHGFTSFRKGVNINTWLSQNGFMSLTGDASQEKRTLNDLFSKSEFFMDKSGNWIVNWRKTQAYSIGLGQIYLNLKGREALGIVTESEYRTVCNQIRDGLLALRDPETGGNVVRDVYIGRDVWSGDYVDSADGQYIAPDLQVGFEAGYRVSWQTALGGMPPDVIELNNEKWSGDHCSVDQNVVPGILVCNKKLVLDDPSIIDIGVTVLRMMGTEPDPDMEGRDILTKSE